MDMNIKDDILSAYVDIAGRRLPRWAELPDLGLYMDQVLALMERYLGGAAASDEKGLTAAMVNNYVKHGVMPPPDRKKYSRRHLACLIVICTLKPVLPLPFIRRLLTAELDAGTEEAFFDRFCAMFEDAGRQAAEAGAALNAAGSGDGTLSPVWAAALRARAEQALAMSLLPPE